MRLFCIHYNNKGPYKWGGIGFRVRGGAMKTDACLEREREVGGCSTSDLEVRRKGS